MTLAVGGERREPTLSLCQQSHHRMMAAPGGLWEAVRLENFPIWRFIPAHGNGPGIIHVGLIETETFLKITLRMKLCQT